MVDNGLPLQLNSSPTKATLRAYDANDLGTECATAARTLPMCRDTASASGHRWWRNGRVFFSTGHDLPTVANPKGELDVYGLK